MLEDQIRAIAREVFAEEIAKVRSDRPDAPISARQVTMVQARRSAAGVSRDELRVQLAQVFDVESLTELSQTRLDELLEWIAAMGEARATVDL